MSVERIEQIDAIEIRPLTGNVGVRKVIRNVENGEEVSRNYLTTHFTEGDDLSAEDSMVQSIANLYWSTR